MQCVLSLCNLSIRTVQVPYWKTPRRFLSRKNVREDLEQVSRVMANNQSQQLGRKNSIKSSRHGEGKKAPKNQSEDQTSGSLPPAPFVSTKEQIEDPLFVISCTFYVNTGHLRCLGTFSFDSFRAVHQNSISNKFITSQFHGS